jgi:hypothetical protein
VGLAATVGEFMKDARVQAVDELNIAETSFV